MFMRVSSIAVALALIAILAGCSKAPVEDLTVTKTALENARLAQADQYVPELYKAAMDSLDAARIEMQKQDSKFAMLRQYGRSKEMLAAAKTAAEEARVEADAQKERVRISNETLIENITSALAGAKTALEKAPRTKGSKADIEMMKADLAAAETSFNAAAADQQAGNFLAAQSALQSVDSQVKRITADLEAARQKLTTKTTTN